MVCLIYFNVWAGGTQKSIQKNSYCIAPGVASLCPSLNIYRYLKFLSDIKIIYTDHVKCLGFYFGVSEFWPPSPEEYDLTLKKFALGLEDASPTRKSSENVSV